MIDTPEVYSAAVMFSLTFMSAMFWYILRYAE